MQFAVCKVGEYTLLTKDNGVYAHALAGAVLRSKLTVKEAAAKSVRFAEDHMKDKAGAI